MPTFLSPGLSLFNFYLPPQQNKTKTNEQTEENPVNQLNKQKTKKFENDTFMVLSILNYSFLSNGFHTSIPLLGCFYFGFIPFP